MTQPLHLFQAFGVELEYMIVDRRTLDVRPLADRVLHAIAGSYESEVEVGLLSWSNELVAHVIELKTNGPVETLDGLADTFQAHVRRIDGMLGGHGCRLMPTAAHPWMDPDRETVLWPHEYSPVYEALDRIFNCKGHGWSNLQCTHLNLPFADDEQFGRLHAAIRLVLPILPALAASSPILDGRPSGLMDTRLEAYRSNARRIPRVSGRVIPEPVYSRGEYDAQILQPLYRDVAPHDPERILQYEWLNARGAIGRWDRNTIEIRVLDVQECPAADLAIVQLLVATLRALVEERWCSYAQQCSWSVDALEPILLDAVRRGDEAVISDPAYLGCFGYGPETAKAVAAAPRGGRRHEGTKARRREGAAKAEQETGNRESANLQIMNRDGSEIGAPAGTCPATARELWSHLFETLFSSDQRESAALAPLRVILRDGCLSRRILKALDGDVSRSAIAAVYGRLCDRLAAGEMLR